MVPDGEADTVADNETIYETPQSGPNATSLDLKYSGGVTIRPGRDPDPDNAGKFLDRTKAALTVIPPADLDGWKIQIDVDKMPSKQHLTLTIKNLKAPELREKRENRYSDDPAADGMETFEVKVLSDHYVTPG